jgi:integrase
MVMQARRYLKVNLICRRTRGRAFIMRWKDSVGKRHEQAIARKRAKNRRQAEKFAADFERVLNGLGDHVRDPITFEQLEKEFLASRATKGLKASALQTYRLVFTHFKDTIAPTDAVNVTPRDVERYLAARAVAGITRHRDWVHLRALFNWAVKREYIPVNPVLKVDPPRFTVPTPFAFTDEEAARFLVAARKRRPWLYATLYLGLAGGLRVSELAAVRADHIDFTRRMLRVPAQKSARDRMVAFPEDVGGILFELRTGNERLLWGPVDAPIFTASTFKARLRIAVRKICKEANVPQPKKPIHDLRKTFGTILARHGTPPLVLQNVMGHSTIVTTQRFYIAPDAERDATRALADLSRAVAGSNGDAAGGKQVASAGHGNADDPSEKEG